MIARRKIKRPAALWKQIENAAKEPSSSGAKPLKESSHTIRRDYRKSLRNISKKRGLKRGKPLKSYSRTFLERARAYSKISKRFKAEFPKCQGCYPIFNRTPRPTEDVHHTRGKIGPLLFMEKHFRALCRQCHDWVGANPDSARNLGLLCEKGQWNQMEKI